MKAYERLLRYAAVWTPSNEESESTPSNACQFDLAHLLVEELHSLGIDAEVDDKCYVYGKIPATAGYEEVPALGLIAHMDTVSDFCGHAPVPTLHENYDGGDLTLRGADGSTRIVRVADFPHLSEMKERTLITSDGTTVLGADDKAGVAEIMTFAEELLASGRPHGEICIGFTPDEEIGRGADAFDVEKFGAAYAYTVDGGLEGEIEYENFNAASAVVHITGFNVHPGSAKGIMKNAGAIACEFQSLLPAEEVPEKTEGYEGFFHLISVTGEVAEAKLTYIIRDHDREKFEEKKRKMQEIIDRLNREWGEGTLTLTLKDSYYNMKEKIEPVIFLIDLAKEATRAAGITPAVYPIRGGTDGARLSFMGLPCPNLGTGGAAFHGPCEHASIEGMDSVVNILGSLCDLYVKHFKK